MKKYKILVPVLLLLVISLVNLNSCKKPEPPKAIVTVTDQNKNAIEGAFVKVYPDVSSPTNEDVNDSTTTDASGKAKFEFKYEGILSVEARATKHSTTTLGADTIITYYGHSILILENDKTYEETVIINGY